MGKLLFKIIIWINNHNPINHLNFGACLYFFFLNQGTNIFYCSFKKKCNSPPPFSFASIYKHTLWYFKSENRMRAIDLILLISLYFYMHIIFNAINFKIHADTILTIKLPWHEWRGQCQWVKFYIIQFNKTHTHTK